MAGLPVTDTAHLLSVDRRFQSLLWPYAAPYLIYVAISSIPAAMMPPETGQAIKLAATGAALLYFRSAYRFGSLRARDGVIALLALPAALLTWIGPFYLLTALGMTDIVSAGGGKAVSMLAFYLRLVNSVILVAVFEELFMRVYVMGWLYQADSQRKDEGLVGSITATLDQHPADLTALPLSTFSVIGTTSIFAAGHRSAEYLSATLYFLFTTWLYKKSGSLWVCILIHGLTNLAIGLLARYGGMGWLW